jgi:hypothetical protein
MGELMSHSWIGGHRERKGATGRGQATSTLHDATTDRVELLEEPPLSAGPSRCPLGILNDHLQLAREVVAEDGRHHEDLVPHEPPGRDVVHLLHGLQLTEHVLLPTAAVVELQDRARAFTLVRDHDLIRVCVRDRIEDVELQRSTTWLQLEVAIDNDSKAVVPALRRPGQLEARPHAIDGLPASPVLDRVFELGKPLEGHADRELDPQPREPEARFLAEMGRIEPRLESSPRATRPCHREHVLDQLPGAVGIMHVAGSMEHVDDLSRLGHGGEEGVVAPFALRLVVTNGGPFRGPALRRVDRSVEIKGQGAEVLQHQTIPDQLAAELPDVRVGHSVHLAQSPTHRRDIGHPAPAETTEDHGVVAVVVHATKPAVAQEQVHDESQRDTMVVIGTATGEVGEATAKAPNQSDPLEELLKDDDPGKGSELLILESELGYASR